MKKQIFLCLYLTLLISCLGLSRADFLDFQLTEKDFANNSLLTVDIESSGILIESNSPKIAENLLIKVLNKNSYSEELKLEVDGDHGNHEDDDYGHDRDHKNEVFHIMVNTFDTERVSIEKLTNTDLEFKISFFEASSQEFGATIEEIAAVGFWDKESTVIPRSKWLNKDKSVKSAKRIGNLNDLSYISKWNVEDLAGMDFQKDGKWLTWPLGHLEEVHTLVVHHTASTKLLNNPKQALNNIYTYHTQSRGWGDIGYHYIIDSRGKVYQGKFGGDTAMGGHSVPLNRHSLGIAIMGNFETDKPSSSVIKSLENLLTEKAQKFNLDPKQTVTIDDITYPVIQGHRDNDHTLCPGEHLYKKLPKIRNTVSANLGKLSGEVSNNQYLELLQNGEIINLKPGKTITKTFRIKHIRAKSTLKKPSIVKNTGLTAKVIKFKKIGKDTYEMKLSIKAKQSLQSKTLRLNFQDDLALMLPLNLVKAKPSLEFSKTQFSCKSKICNLKTSVKNTSKNLVKNVEIALDGYNTKRNFPTFSGKLTNIYLKPKEKKTLNLKVLNSRNYLGNIYLNAFNEQGMLGDDSIKINLKPKGATKTQIKSKDFVFAEKNRAYQTVFLKFRNVSQAKGSLKLTLDDQKLLLKKPRFSKSGNNLIVYLIIKKNLLQPGGVDYSLKYKGATLYTGKIQIGSKSKLKSKLKSSSQSTTANDLTGSLKKDEISILISKVRQKELKIQSSQDVKIKINRRTQLLKSGRVVKLRALKKGMIVDFDGKKSPATHFEILGSDSNINTLVNYENRPTFNLDLNDNQFRGSLKVKSVGGKLEVVNKLGLESYLKGLAEISDYEHPEKIKTIVIAARSYAYYYMVKDKKFKDKTYNLDDDPQVSQKYLGYGFEKRAPNVIKVVEETKGQMLTYKGEIIKVPYFSQSNGRTKSAKEVWGWTNTPYLQSVVDDCNQTEFKGHGVGISGCGAKNMALKGSKFREIISHYLPGTKIKTFE